MPHYHRVPGNGSTIKNPKFQSRRWGARVGARLTQAAKGWTGAKGRQRIQGLCKGPGKGGFLLVWEELKRLYRSSSLKLRKLSFALSSLAEEGIKTN